MASLKDLRNRIASVQSTQRITSAMKMVAAAKLRKAQQNAEAARPYAERMERMLRSLAQRVKGSGTAPALLVGTGREDAHLLVLVTSDRGLCGGFNGNMAREVRGHIDQLVNAGKTVKLLIIGRKGVTLLRREHGGRIVDAYEELAKPAPNYAGAETVCAKIVELFESGEFDVCTLYYNRFVSVLTQEVTPLQLIPFAVGDTDGKRAVGTDQGAQYEYEPGEEEILDSLLPHNLTVQVFRSMLESFASEQGARMSAMDNATRNAKEMIEKLSITYNRTRQAQITKELIEIVSGAEAL